MAFSRGVANYYNNATGGLGPTRTGPSTGCTAGRAIIVSLTWDNASARTLTSVTCSGETDATILSATFWSSSTIDYRGQIAVFPSLASSGTKTIVATMSGTFSYLLMGLSEY